MKRILIIAGGLQVGGAERVAANIALYDTHKEFEFHYLVFKGLDNIYGAEIEEHGGKIFTIPSPSDNYFMYIRSLVKLMKEYKYSVVHSHTMFNSGINLLIAKIMGVPCRIAHSHSISSGKKQALSKSIYQKIMRILIQKCATDYIGCGKNAGEWLFGEKFYSKYGVTILNGVHTDEFKFNDDSRYLIRDKYNVNSRFIIGHVGHLYPVKNQIFLLKLMPEIIKKNPSAILFLIGEGHDRSMLENTIVELKLQNHVIMTGNVLNVNEYLSAMDVFAFPSLYEGMPLSILEVQTNGLPCVISDAVPRDVYLTDLLKVLSLDQSPEEWIEAILNSKRMESEKYCSYMFNEGYDTYMMVKKLYNIYKK